MNFLLFNRKRSENDMRSEELLSSVIGGCTQIASNPLKMMFFGYLSLSDDTEVSYCNSRDQSEFPVYFPLFSVYK